MSRRLWSAILAGASILLLGTYLVFTQHLVGQIRQRATVDVQIFSLVQGGMVNIPNPDSMASALSDIQAALQQLDVPIVVLYNDTIVNAAANLPFEAERGTPAGDAAILGYVQRVLEREPQNIIVRDLGEAAGVTTIVYDDPRILGWLRWVPPLQVGAGALLIVIALVIVRADMRAQREKLYSAMARELAHQMGTPLSSLSGWVEVLQLTADERALMATPQKIGQVMQADVERLERVSRRFELIGKPQALELVAVQDVARELESYFRPRLPHLGKGITLRVRVPRGLPPIRANPVLLVWALENIVKNAIDALAGRGGRISIVAWHRPVAKSTEETIRIIIADNGPGIAPSMRDRIFEPGVTTKSAGWGVGLSLSRRIIEELHHGRIAVHGRGRAGAATPAGSSGRAATENGGGRSGAAFEVMLPVART